MIKTLAKTFLFLILLANVAVIPLAHAQDTQPPPQDTSPAQQQDKKTPKKGKELSDVNCDDLSKPDQTINLVITILEETIGAPSVEKKDETTKEKKDKTTKIITCFRETKCTEFSKGEPKICIKSESKYTESCTPSEEKTCSRVQVFIAKSGAGLLYAYIGTIYRWAAGTIGIVCVLFLVVGGVQISIAGDNQGMVDSAKERITQSIAGLVLLLLSAIILYTINPNFFVL